MKLLQGEKYLLKYYPFVYYAFYKYTFEINYIIFQIIYSKHVQVKFIRVKLLRLLKEIPLILYSTKKFKVKLNTEKSYCLFDIVYSDVKPKTVK